MEIPDTLKLRIDLFKQNAHAYQADGELFRVDSWTQVMLGQRIMPKHYHGLVKTMKETDLTNFLNSLEVNIANSVSQLPFHNDFVKQYCAST